MYVCVGTTATVCVCVSCTCIWVCIDNAFTMYVRVWLHIHVFRCVLSKHFEALICCGVYVCMSRHVKSAFGLS